MVSGLELIKAFRAQVFSLLFKPPTNFGRGIVCLNWVWTHGAESSLTWGESCNSSAHYTSQRLLNSGAVYRKYKASAEMSAGGSVYTEDSGPGHGSELDPRHGSYMVSGLELFKAFRSRFWIGPKACFLWFPGLGSSLGPGDSSTLDIGFGFFSIKYISN
jgi:hypothetical protein